MQELGSTRFGSNLDIKHPTVKSLLDSTKRKERKPINRKDPNDRYRYGIG